MASRGVDLSRFRVFSYLAIGLMLTMLLGGGAKGQTLDTPLRRLGIGTPLSLAYSPDGKYIAVGTSTGEMSPQEG